MLHKNLLILGAAMLMTTNVPTAKAQSDARAMSLEGGATLFAELETSLDSKKAKADEQVVVRVNDVVKAQGKVIFPKGTRVVGRLVQAAARGKGDADSLLAIQLEKAVLKGGEEIPVRLAIKAIAPPRQFSAGETPGQDPMAGTHAGTMTSPMGSGRQSTTVDRSAGSAGDSNPGSSDGGQLTPESHGVYGMNGVHLAVDVTRAIPVSVVSSTGKNVRLDGGTRLLLVSIADAPGDSKQ